MTMEALTFLLSFRNILLMTAIYLFTVAFYRIYFHPLAKFPGPKLAAITRYYEGYFDLIQNGQYTFKIKEMHKKYGPIIRISPHELHIMDPFYHQTLYRQEGHWNKYPWNYDAFTSKGSTICTTDHDIHRARRAPMASFFSKAKVSAQEEMIKRNAEKLCERLSGLSNTTFNLGAAISAYTQDVASEFILGKNYHSLDREDFNVGMTGVFQKSAGRVWCTTKYLRWFGPMMQAIPSDWVMKMADEKTQSFFRYLKIMEKDSEILVAAASSQSELNEVGTRTIVNGILESDLPPSEKTCKRICDEVTTVSGAGFETSANVLRLICFHVFSQPKILKQLRNELASAKTSHGTNKLVQLEHLPFLTSVLMEGLRLSPGIATRLQRIAPDRDLIYGEWSIPSGTPVGMTNMWMHLDEKLYPDPMRFDPDRWMDLEARKILERTFAPFSKGTRICIGMNLAWAEMYIALAALVQRFDFQFNGVTSKDFECQSDQFIIGTRDNGNLHACVTDLG
ncbi:hypothetical protein HYFRA_00012376 [Hymenoscyphus fraxineus]|uniref:Trichodiene oxygenase n=1 Tax=Hymenoscyphus fraxineus TaxID=746836 RepID=A0A9N9LA31_9HELO|nr:hypothetical protein HYFRA_00012376 [Hymenoscyphus fraxineus]